MSEPPDGAPRPAPVGGFTFFMDISLGHNLTADGFRQALDDAGHGDTLVRFRDVFDRQDVTDEDWINEIAPRGWVVLTKDERIRKNRLERRALAAGQVAAFFLARGDVDGETNGRMLAAALSRIRRLLLDYCRPLLAVVHRHGRVVLIEGKRARKSARPKRPRPKPRRARRRLI